MPAESCLSAILAHPPPQQQRGYFHLQHGPLEGIHFTISDSSNDIKQESSEEPSGFESCEEDKTFAGTWQQASDEGSAKSSLGEIDASNNDNLKYNHRSNIGTPNENSPAQYQVPDEVSLESQDHTEGSITPFVSTGSASSPCPDPARSTKEPISFLFVGPLGKKRKYSRQRTASDDNESESQLQIVTGSPEPTEEEMDQSQSPSHGDNSESSVDNQGQQGTSTQNQEANVSIAGESRSMTRGEPVSTIISPAAMQRATPESGGESEHTVVTSTPASTTEGSTSNVIISKPLPITGAPTSVIRRVSRKKQENPLPLNLSVSSPPGSSNSNFPPSPEVLPAASPGRTNDFHSCPTTNPSIVREELYFEGRQQSERPVFVWRYRDDATGLPMPAPADPMSPSLSTISSTSFLVPDVGGSVKLGSSGASSASSGDSRLCSGAQDHNRRGYDDEASDPTSNSSGKQPKKKLRCGDCGKEFSQLRNYRYHRSRHEGSDQFACTCPVCGKQFNDRGYLSSHMKIHRNAKEYRCEYCSKGFNQRVAYNMHRRIHTGHRPHQCEVCGKSFSRRMLLKQHMRIHTGERPYSCGVCNKAFADRSNMLLHQRLHSGERPYVCAICKKSFSKNHHLKTHMNHHAGIKPYECPKCHARFSQSSNMKTHLKKCSGVPNPSTSQRQHMLRRPLEVARPAALAAPLPPLPTVSQGGSMMRGKEPLPSLPGTSRLLYKQQQQSLSILTQSISGGPGVLSTTTPQLSPVPTRGQVPIESLLLHLNVGRSRHPSQGSVHSAPPTSPTPSVSLSDFQQLLRNAAAAAASTGSRSASTSSSHGAQTYSSSASPPLSSMGIPSATVTTSGMTAIPGMANFGGMVMSPTAVNSRYSPSESTHLNETIPPSHMPPMVNINQNLGLAGYEISSGSRGSGQMDSSAMPPPQSNGASVLRNIPTPTSFIHPDLLPPSPGNMLRIDTRSLDSFSSVGSPPDRSPIRQNRLPPNQMGSPRRKLPSPSSSLSTGSLIPLSTLESAAIASGLRSPSQMVQFLSSALREAEGPLHSSSHSSTRLPSLQQRQHVLEAMVAAASAEQHAGVASSTVGTGNMRHRQIPSPHMHQQTPSSHPTFQFSGDSPSLPSLHLSQSQAMITGGPQHSSIAHSIQSHQTASSPPLYSVITSSHLLQQQHNDHHQQQQHALNIQRVGTTFSRFVTASSSSSATSRLSSSLDEHHSSVDQAQHIELQPQPLPQQHRQQGYHQTLLQSRVNQGTVAPGYSGSGNGNTNPSHSTFNHSIISRSRSHSPNTIEHLRDRSHNYPNE